MDQLLAFAKDNSVALLVVAYGLCLMGSHIKGPVGTFCKYLLAGKLVKLPQTPPSA